MESFETICKTSSHTTTVHTTRASLTRAQLITILGLPDDAIITIDVPSGSNYGGEELEMGPLTTLDIKYETVEESETKEEI